MEVEEDRRESLREIEFVSSLKEKLCIVVLSRDGDTWCTR